MVQWLLNSSMTGHFSSKSISIPKCVYFQNNHISMGWCKKDVTPLELRLSCTNPLIWLTHWYVCSFCKVEQVLHNSADKPWLHLKSFPVLNELTCNKTMKVLHYNNKNYACLHYKITLRQYAFLLSNDPFRLILHFLEDEFFCLISTENFISPQSNSHWKE